MNKKALRRNIKKIINNNLSKNLFEKATTEKILFNPKRWGTTDKQNLEEAETIYDINDHTGLRIGNDKYPGLDGPYTIKEFIKK